MVAENVAKINDCAELEPRTPDPVRCLQQVPISLGYRVGSPAVVMPGKVHDDRFGTEGFQFGRSQSGPCSMYDSHLPLATPPSLE